MLEHELIVPAHFDHDCEFVEVLDARLEVPAVHQMYRDRQPIATGEIEKDILDRRLRRCRAWFSDLGHQRPSPRPARRSVRSSGTRLCGRVNATLAERID